MVSGSRFSSIGQPQCECIGGGYLPRRWLHLRAVASSPSFHLPNRHSPPPPPPLCSLLSALSLLHSWPHLFLIESLTWEQIDVSGITNFPNIAESYSIALSEKQIILVHPDAAADSAVSVLELESTEKRVRLLAATYPVARNESATSTAVLRKSSSTREKQCTRSSKRWMQEIVPRVSLESDEVVPTVPEGRPPSAPPPPFISSR